MEPVLVITRASDLRALRAGRPPGRVALRVPGKPVIELGLREDRLARALGACGCVTTGAFVLAGLIGAPFLFLTGLLDGLTVRAVAGILLACLAILALTGAAVGRLRALRARRRELDALARWIEAA